jgi:hypothetical protein
MNRGVEASMSGTNQRKARTYPQSCGSSLSPCRPCGDGGEGSYATDDDVLEEVGVQHLVSVGRRCSGGFCSEFAEDSI